MSTLKPYPAYKDSGVEWLGEVPGQWSVDPLGRWFTERKTTVSDEDFQPLSVTKQGIVRQLSDVAKTENNASRKLVLAGDFAINSRSDRKGSSGVSKLDGSVSVITTVLRGRGLDPKYTHYLLRSQPFQEEFYRWGHGIVEDLWSTRWSEMKNIRLPIPQSSEQRAIADFLDRETAEIDEFVAESEKLITLLNERRAAVIAQAVTKGLDPTVAMKDTGIEWLGEIPAHWSAPEIRRYYALQIGKMLNETKFSGEPAPYVRAGNIQDYGLDLSEVKMLPVTDAEKTSLAIRSGDVLFVEGGAGYGRSDYVEENLEGWVFQNWRIAVSESAGPRIQ